MIFVILEMAANDLAMVVVPADDRDDAGYSWPGMVVGLLPEGVGR